MGEVYRARDLDLGRDVALKVLPAEFARDPHRLARFDREARAAAALNHPNVLVVYEVGESSGTPFVVAELLAGQTLRLLMARPLSVPRALDYITQVAQGLAAAHDNGVVHRDIKPENLLVTSDDRVKILDFGIATIADEAAGASLSTLTAPGAVIGTTGYMAPEQARGEAVDARADVFALGAVWFEMLTSRRAFPGATATEALAAILTQTPPDVSRLNPDVPAGVARIIHRCLEKQRENRFQSARDVTFALEAVRDPGPEPASALWPWRRWVAVAALVLAAGALGSLLTALQRPASTSTAAPPRRTTVVTPASARLSPGDFVPFALSPDGTTIAYTTSQPERLFLRRLDDFDVTEVSGTDGAFDPFFSPDNQWIGYWTHGEIKKVPVAGGPPVLVCQAADMLGASWGDDGSIVYAPGLGGLFAVAASGGTPRALTTLDLARGDVQHVFPQYVSRGRAVLFTALSQSKDAPFSVELYDVATNVRRTLVPGGQHGRLLPSGHLAYVRDHTLFAVRVATDTLQPQGTAVAVLTDLQTGVNGEALVSFAADGTLAYVPYHPPTNHWLEWIDRTGRATRLTLPPRPYGIPRLSPDGRTIALAVEDGVNTDIWLSDIGRGTLERLTFGRRHFRTFRTHTFLPDGSRLAYAEDTATGARVVVHAVDGMQDPRPLLSWPRRIAPAWVTRAEDMLLSEFGAGTGADVLLLPKGQASPHALVSDPGNQWGPVLSPDERYAAYASEEAGRYEIFVTAYPGPGPRRQVTTEGGVEVRWSRDGRELYYRSGDRMTAVEIETTPLLRVGRARQLFEGRFAKGAAGLPAYDVAPDGRFLMMRAESEPPIPELRLVSNWFAELRRLVP